MNLATVQASGLSLLAAASWGGGDFSGGVATKRASVFRVVAVAHACGLLATLAMALLSGVSLPPASALWWGAFAGFVGAFGIAALYRALAVGRMGVVALVSIWLLAGPNTHENSPSGLGLAALAGIAFGMFLIAGKHAGHDGVFWPLVAARCVSTALMVVIVGILPRDERPLRPVLWPVVLSGLLDSAGNALFIAATRYGRLDVAAVLSSLYPASTVILARFLLKERIARLQAIGIALALTSAALISLA